MEVFLVVAGIGLLVVGYLLRRIRGKYHRERQTTHFIEDLLKEAYEAPDHTVQSKRLLTLSSLPEAEREAAVHLAISRGWLTADSSVEGGVQASDAGVVYGAHIARAHRLYERFLAEHTEFPCDEWHPRAEQAEHSLHPRDLDTLARSLGNPLTAPNGEPIPRPDGKLPDLGLCAAADAPDGAYTLSVVDDRCKELSEALKTADLHVGSPVQLTTAGDDRRLVAQGRGITLPTGWPKLIHLTPIEKPKTIPGAESTKPLNKLIKGEQAVIEQLSPSLSGMKRRRLMDLGFVRGGSVEVYLKGPVGNTVAYLVKDTAVALRDDQAAKILVRTL